MMKLINIIKMMCMINIVMMIPNKVKIMKKGHNIEKTDNKLLNLLFKISHLNSFNNLLNSNLALKFKNRPLNNLDPHYKNKVLNNNYNNNSVHKVHQFKNKFLHNKYVNELFNNKQHVTQKIIIMIIMMMIMTGKMMMMMNIITNL